MSQDPQPLYYAAVVTIDDGDARIMCVVQHPSTGSPSIHYLRVDTSLDEVRYDFILETRRTFREELRGMGLAVNVLAKPVDDIVAVIERDLTSAYGELATINVKQVESPSISSLFV